MNKIQYTCPNCECADADVLAIINEKEVRVRCLSNGRKHGYAIDPNLNSQWKQFFKKEAIDKVKK